MDRTLTVRVLSMDYENEKFYYALEALVASNEFIFEQIQSKEPNTKVEPTSKLNPSKNPEISSIAPIPPIISKTEKNSHEFEPRQNDLRSKEMLNR